MTLHQLIIHLANCHHQFYSIEKPNLKASNGEIKRWILNSSVEVNHHICKDPLEEIDFPVVKVVVHPKSTKERVGRRNTIFAIEGMK